jgi:hypothetical protein
MNLPTPVLLVKVEKFMNMGIEERTLYDREFQNTVNM